MGVRVMGFVEAIQTVYSKYVTFSGRASRSEFWWFQLFYSIVVIGISFVSYAVSSDGGSGFLVLIWELGNLLPVLAVGIRRLHDIDRSGWWVLIALIPLVGWIVLLVWDCTEGTGGDNRFGPDPLLATP
jgi:uncharacterized membrane protein YhaH (DUF805 family)